MVGRPAHLPVDPQTRLHPCKTRTRRRGLYPGGYGYGYTSGHPRVYPCSALVGPSIAFFGNAIVTLTGVKWSQILSNAREPLATEDVATKFLAAEALIDNYDDLYSDSYSNIVEDDNTKF
ncbi:uncharacterized protein B0H18DRAFT_1124353 [Fomitopsis serialis]|uniref:uncharacterized protein n=1 Tax=Fomitopsis serialis TaxID=139415 RepID=UPI0020086837|nr:uncharacterized protein B0H18DRAFT_1124353 [Neoantrodia serialis]KAH9916216.1 hypothetical protein B0H18DRAFT_1124353 [Neoantrodia serialis]